jgi:cobalt-zinc-cadmium resistance protein CzcA
VREVVNSAAGGVDVSMMIQGDRRFPITLRLPDSWHADIAQLGNLQVQSPAGELVRLNQVARLTSSRGPEIVSRERARRRIVVQSNVRGTDLGSFVANAQRHVKEGISLPAGYSITWGGQFENQARASQRLIIILPVSVIAIFALLFATFGSAGESLLILCAVPFAMVGGIGALWLRGMNLNLSASIGFIALFGVAVLNGIVMVTIINQLRVAGAPIELAVRRGAALRLRPVLMTALVASLGFAPMAFSQAQGAEVQRPLATVVIGGLVTATILTLFLIPAAYPWFCRKHLSKIDEMVTRYPNETEEHSSHDS